MCIRDRPGGAYIVAATGLGPDHTDNAASVAYVIRTTISCAGDVHALHGPCAFIKHTYTPYILSARVAACAGANVATVDVVDNSKSIAESSLYALHPSVCLGHDDAISQHRVPSHTAWHRTRVCVEQQQYFVKNRGYPRINPEYQLIGTDVGIAGSTPGPIEAGCGDGCIQWFILTLKQFVSTL